MSTEIKIIEGDERILVLNRGEKADAVRCLLTEAGIHALLCSDVSSLSRAAEVEISALLLPEEVLCEPETVRMLSEWLQRQPAWSDIPILALVQDEGNAEKAQALGNVVLLTDPLSPLTLVSAARTAFRSRRRQLQYRESLAEAERKIALLHERKRLFRSVFDQAAVGIALAAPDGTLLLVNAKLGEMLGYLPDDLQGRNFLHLPHRDDLPDNEALARQLLGGALDSYTLEKRFIRRDGTALWVGLTCSTVPGPTGDPEFIVAVAEDISQHRAAEEALRLSEERLRLATEAAHIGIWQWEVSDGRQRWDARCKALFGLPPEAPVSFQTWKNSLHPDDRTRMEKETILFLAGDVDSKEYRVVWPDGSVHWLLARGTSHLDESGRPARMVGIVMDISERKAAEEALRLGQERLRLATDAAGIGIWQWNIVQDRFLWDERCAALFGYPLLGEEASLRDFLALLHPKDRDRVKANLPKAMERPEINTEFRVIWPDGSLHWILVRGRTQFDAQGNPSRMNGIIMEVTTRKTAEVLLQEAKEAAETANRTKSEFLANISHEIRTPMTVAMGAHELLQETELQDEQRQYLEMAQVALSTLLRLIDEILDYSRLESGKMLFEVESFDLYACLQDAVGAFNLEAGRKGLELALSIADDVPHLIRGDANRLRQVLTNLIGNAVKFTTEGTVRVNTAISRDGDGKEMLLFSVRDTGIGISPEKQHLLFQSFSQVDSSHTRRYGGTGLGLALSRRIVERLGGEIWMESEPGKGSAFFFTIPLERPVWAWAEASRESEQRERGVAHRAPEGNPSPRILMAEDDPMLRELLEIILSNRHWDVDAAENGREALDAWESEKFDLILMDVQMPEMDGLEATRTIREREKGMSTHTPIIAMTAHVREEDRRQCLEAGMDDYLSKPVQMSDLYAKLEKYLETKH